MTYRRIIVLLAWTLASPATAAAPRDELLRLVPGDVGFCLVIDDLRGHARQLLESPFVQQLRKSPMGSLLDQDRDWQKFAEAQKQVERLLGIETAKLRDDIVGDAIVFAYRPGAPNKPNEDQDLILVHARDPQALAKLVERINVLQIGSKELKELEPREYNGRKYFHRVDAKGANFYALLGPILAVSSQEAMLRDTLDRVRPAESQVEPIIGRQLRSLLGPERRLVSLWINPRAFDAAIVAKADPPRAEQAAVIKSLVRYWKALEGVALAVGLHDHLEGTIALRVKPEGLSPAARRFFGEASKPSDLWRLFPENAMFAAAGRFDAPAFEELLGEFLTPEARRTLHDSLDRFIGAALDKDVIKEVLPCLGPEWGFCVVAPDDADKNWVPHALFALRVRPGDRRPFVDQALLSAVNALAQVAVIDHNNKNADRMSLKTELRDKLEVKYLSDGKRFPPGFRPAFALGDGYLLLATTPEAIRRFGSTTTRETESTPEFPVLRVSFKQLRGYLQARRGPLAAVLAEQNKGKPEDVERQLDGIVQALQLFDRLDVGQRVTGGQATLTFRLRMAHALHK